MNLKAHLLTRIVLIAALSLMATAAYVLFRAEVRSRQIVLTSTESIGRQLEFQLLRIDAGFDLPERFPDLELWKEVTAASGLCVRFISSTTALVRSICSKAGVPAELPPVWFEAVYRWLYPPNLATVRQIHYKDRRYGAIRVSRNGEIAVGQAWERISDLAALSGMTVLGVCVLIYAVLSRALRPAQLIVAGLEKMRGGDLSFRLPEFELTEWRRTGSAINQLAENQERLLSERRKLIVKLMTLQEEERRYLARELHDELGQCLAAIHAVASSIAYTADQACPSLVPEAGNISRITSHAMSGLRALLLRLRPTEIDELGLSASLNSLVSRWNANSGGRIHYELAMAGDLDRLADPIPVTVYRIVQECLTNIAKHSSADRAVIKVELASNPKEMSAEAPGSAVSIRIQDDGVADSLPFPESNGIGLLGIRERVAALGGELKLEICRPSGLSLQAWLPIPHGRETGA